jgi:hypothetical protein
MVFTEIQGDVVSEIIHDKNHYKKRGCPFATASFLFIDNFFHRIFAFAGVQQKASRRRFL